MVADFRDAHERHWESAELLYKSEHWANADHLYGLSAECGVKTLMCAFGMKMKDDSKPAEYTDCKHIDKISVRYEYYRSIRYPQNYDIDLSRFEDWDVNQRYEHRSVISEQRLAEHKIATTDIRKILRLALMEGVI